MTQVGSQWCVGRRVRVGEHRLSAGAPGEVVNNSCRDPAPTENGSPVCSLSLCGSVFDGVSTHLLFLQPCVVPGASVQTDEFKL